MLRLEPRAEPSRALLLASPLLALVLTAAVAALLFAWLGKDPLRGLSVFFVEPLAGTRAVSEVLLKATPLALCALGLAICYRANIWNIGAEGQLLLGAVAGGGVALALAPYAQGMPRGAFAPLVLLAGTLGGMAWAAIVAVLRDRFNANEILVSLMLVYVAQQLVNYLVFGPWKDPQGFNFPQTPRFDPATWMLPLAAGTRLHWGVLLVPLAAAAAWIFLFRSLRGYQLLVGGLAPAAARYAGFSARGALWLALLVSGAAAGLAGAMEAAGPLRQLTPHVSTGIGFTAIIVCFVGRLHPLGIVLASMLLSMMLIGGELAQSRLALPNALSSVFQGLLLFLLLGCDALVAYRLRWVGRGARVATVAGAAAPGADAATPDIRSGAMGQRSGAPGADAIGGGR